MNKTIALLSIILLASCTYEKGGITDDMTLGLHSFEYEEVNYPAIKDGDSSSQKSYADDAIVEHKTDSLLSIDYYAEEVGCPTFEGGFLLKDKTLTLYYQDVNFKLVKCIGLYKLTYTFNTKNIDYKKIKINRLKAVKKGFSF